MSNFIGRRRPIFDWPVDKGLKLGVKRIHRNPDRSGSAEDPFESSKIRRSADPKKKKIASPAGMHDVPRPRQLRAWTLRDRLRPAICNNQHAMNIHSHCMHSMFQRDDARLSQAYRYIAGENSWMQKVASAQQKAESPHDVFSLSSFRNAQWNQWLSLKVQVQPVLRSVLACGRSLRFRQGKKQPVCRLCRKLRRLSTRSEQQASLWCTCNPVASSPNIGVSLLAR